MFTTTGRSCFVALLLVLSQHGGVATAQDPAFALEDAVVKLIERAEPSVVSIARIKPEPYDQTLKRLNRLDRMPRREEASPTDSEDPDFQPNEFGAGIVISAPGSDERLVLTNYHVVRGGPVTPANSTEDGTSLLIRFADRRSCDASIIAADPRCDLAVLRLHLSQAMIDASDLKPLDWSTSTTTRKGQFVVMLGNPHAIARDGSASASWGMVSNLARRPLPWTTEGASKMLYRLGNILQIDGRLNLGTSGGPVLNLKGELIGLTTSLAVVEGYEKSAGFAIPFDDLTRRLVKSLVAGHEVEYGMLGLVPMDVKPSEFRTLGIVANQGSAAKAGRISPDSPADRAGIEKDDVFLKIAGEPVFSDHDLMRLVGLHAPETELEVLVWRSGRELPFPVKIKLGKWPVADDEGIIETNPRFAPWRGLSVEYPTGRLKWSPEPVHRDELPPYRRAVLVCKVAAESFTHAAGLQPGVFISHVNKSPVQTPAEFHAAVKSSTGPVTLRLYEGRTVVVRE